MGEYVSTQTLISSVASFQRFLLIIAHKMQFFHISNYDFTTEPYHGQRHISEPHLGISKAQSNVKMCMCRILLSVELNLCMYVFSEKLKLCTQTCVQEELKLSMWTEAVSVYMQTYVLQGNKAVFMYCLSPW